MKGCRWPDHAVVVDSQGWLKPCCMMTGIDMNHHKNLDQTEINIEQIERLEDYGYSNFISGIRNSLKANGIEGTPLCHNCQRQIECGSRSHSDDSVFEWLNKDHKNYTPGEISYLEITTSNICNQTCITCNSYFSSKWKTIEHLFDSHDRPKGANYVMSENAFNKILNILPQIKTLMIKGGEPFSDLRNAVILERMSEVNPDCEIWITSNCSIISKRFMDVLKKFNPNKVNLIASLDHVFKKYEWIRGTNFNQTLDTCKRLYEEAGILPRALPTISYFNILDIPEIIEFYTACPYIWISDKGLSNMNIVKHPYEMDYLKTRTQAELDTVNEGLISEFDPLLYGSLKQKIEIMNGVRGFRWQDC